MPEFQVPEYVKITSNLVQEINEIAKKILISNQATFEENNEMLLQLLNFFKRQIPMTPRSVKISKDLKIDEKYEDAYKQFIRKVTLGGNLNPYLSSTIERSNFQDALYNTMGLVHFHLGTKLLKKKPKLNNRYFEKQQDILIAKVTQDTIYFIALEPHHSPDWSKEEYLNHDIRPMDVTFLHDKYIHIMAKEFPELLEHSKVTSMTVDHELDTKGHVILKKNNVNTATVVGENAYFSPEFGVTCSGHNINDIRLNDIITSNITHDLKQIKNYLYSINQYILLDKVYEIKLKAFCHINQKTQTIFAISRGSKEIIDVAKVDERLLLVWKDYTKEKLEIEEKKTELYRAIKQTQQ